jgi:hypothetical protein
MTIFESRATWGARSSRGSTYLASTKGVKAHYTGGHVNPATLTDHNACRAAVRGIQNGHMDGNGWNDIGYSAVVCNHDRVMLGRGAHVLPAANGAGLNSGHYAILVLVGTSGVTSITDNMKTAFHAARDYFRSKGSAGKEIKGHRDGYATSCPGPSVYPWVQAGAPKPSGSATPPPNPKPEGGDVPQYYSYGRSSANPIEVPAGSGWTKITWDTEWSDPGNEHQENGYGMLTGDPSLYAAKAFVRFSGLAPGSLVEGRFSEYRYSAGPPAADNLEEAGWTETAVVGADGNAAFSEIGSLAEGRKLVLEVRHGSAGPVTVVGARVKIDAWQ